MDTKNLDSGSKRDRTREMILNCAMEMFREQGFEGTTMRGIAEACGLSLGAAYYHFASKDALVLAFYERGGAEAREHATELFTETRDFRARLSAVLIQRLEQLAPYRNVVLVLAGHAVNLSSPLSPFSEETRPMRDEAIALMEAVLEGSDARVSKALRPHLPKLLWLMQLGVVLYWANDRSENQSRTLTLIEHSLDGLLVLLRASTLPLMTPVIRSFLRLLSIAELCTAPAEEGTV